MAQKTWLQRLVDWFGSKDEIGEVPDEMTDEWRRILEENMFVYSRLPEEAVERLERWVLEFLRHIPFEGCSGLEITDEMRVTVAGWASLLVLNRRGARYPFLHRVLVYPDGFRITEGGFFFPEEDTGFDAAGESWEEGYVVLAWSDCLRSIEEPGDGFNVMLHELAHQVDMEGGEVDGVPVLDPEQRRRWDRIMAEDYRRFLDRIARGRQTAMDDYGAEDPGELFAVATETFFEKPVPLQEEHPGLYGLLRDFYGFDPASWPTT